MGSVLLFLYKNFVSLIGIICYSMYTYILPLFRSRFFRGDEGSENGNSENSEISSVKNRALEELEPMIETESNSKQEFGNFGDGFSKKEETGFRFQFKFPSYEEFCKNRNENGDYRSFEPVHSNYDFSPVNGLGGFISEPENLKLDYENDGEEFDDEVLSIDENYEQINSKGIDEELQKEAEENENQGQEEEQIQLCSDAGSICSGPVGSVSERVINSDSDGFLSGSDFQDEFEYEDEHELLDELPELGEKDANSVHGEKTYTIDELRKIEEAHYKNMSKLKPEFLSERDFGGERETDPKKGHGMLGLGETETSSVNDEKTYTIDELKKIEEVHYKYMGKLESQVLPEKDCGGENGTDSKKADSEDKSEWDSDSDELWEHQELIEQLKMELKKVRATGLPTILEESEYPKIADDLKPWKIDEKSQNAGRAGELHKFYNSYRDRMRKLDILNYQKMHAIGFLQLKDPLQSMSSSVPSVSALLSHNLFSFKRKRIGNDPMMKFVVELQSDLELVYVGHMCLSWEILYWQYGKALELWESDPRGVCMYNEVAGDFQQFQVLTQRFIEDEAFQGPRVQNYVKSRCALRNLLQVPLIKEDNSKDRKKALKRREMGSFAITSDTLVEILEESIRIFWRFVRADKDCSSSVVKSQKGLHIQLQDPADSELLMEVQGNLQKKEKKLKDLLRGGNCILRKFRRREEDDSDQVLYFFSQVDMKLVGRVLNMPRVTTDQLIWCRNKLQNISFVNKRIQVDRSFLLFPC